MESDQISRRYALTSSLQAMSRAAVRRHGDFVRRQLRSRWPEVRAAAAEALERGVIGADWLASALLAERNDVVLATMCEALLVLGDSRSIAVLKRLARNHRSWLVRRHAAWAVSELGGRGSVPFLRSLLPRERSLRVRATIQEGLAKHGDTAALESLLAMLGSGDYIVRTSIANFFAENVVIRRGRKKIVERLRRVLATESIPAAKEALRNAIAGLS